MNCPGLDQIVYQYSQKIHPPQTKHVVCEYEVLVWERLGQLGDIYRPCALEPAQWNFFPRTPCTYPTSSMGYNLYSMNLPWWMSLDPYSYCMTSLMIYCGSPWAYVPLQSRPGFMHPWVFWWTTIQMLGGCYISSVPQNLIVLICIPCLPPRYLLLVSIYLLNIVNEDEE